MFLRAFGSSSSSSTSDSSLDPSLPPTGTQYEPYNALLRLTVAFQRFSGGGHGTSVIVSPRVVPVKCLRFLAVNLGRDFATMITLSFCLTDAVPFRTSAKASVSPSSAYEMLRIFENLFKGCSPSTKPFLSLLMFPMRLPSKIRNMSPAVMVISSYPASCRRASRQADKHFLYRASLSGGMRLAGLLCDSEACFTS